MQGAAEAMETVAVSVVDIVGAAPSAVGTEKLAGIAAHKMLQAPLKALCKSHYHWSNC